MTGTTTTGGLPRPDGLIQRVALLEVPFPGGISSDVESARRHTIGWLCDFGMLEGRAAVEEYDALRLERAMARFYPRAVGEDLELATDVNGWFFVFDDQFDGLLGQRPDEVAGLVESVLRVMDEERPTAQASANPLVESFRDLWRRVNDGRPALWRRRFGQHWRGYLLAHHREALNRTGDVLPTVEEFLSARRHTIGIQPCLDLAERCGRYTLPEELHSGFPLAAMRQITDDVAIFVNDLVSLDKELAVGDVNNTVILLQRHTGRPLQECVREICAVTNARTARFQELTARLSGLLADTGASAALRADVEDYVDGMRNVMRGNLDWSLESGRYDATGVAAVSDGRQRPWARLLAVPEPG